MATIIPSAENSQAHNYNVENFVLMWADASVNSIKENLQAQKSLTQIHNQFNTFESVDECENAIQQLPKTSRAIIIISGGFGRELLPRIHELPQVLTIYVFCMDQAKYLEWAKQFNKIKAIIVDLHKLISTIQFDHEQRINVKKPMQINVLDTNSKSVPDTFRYSSNYLVIAGELQYTEKTMKDIATEIVNRFKSDPNHDFNALISETVEPIMYLLKREQNLADFSGQFKRLLSKEKDIPCVSQRFLIDTIMMNSDRFLCRRLTSLLCKRNSVPMIQPPLGSTNNEYRSISNIIHVWDYYRPVLLSFGIGQCKGKTSLINTLFDSNFEQSMKDRYFSATVDVDFGYHFIERRPINIADTHGEISSENLAQISMLFNGFLIHVDSKYLCSNQWNVIKYLKLLSSQSYVLLLIRDVDGENDEKIQSTVETICSVCSHCQSHYLPNVTDKTTEENREKIDEVREKIFRDTAQLQCLDEKSIQEHLKRLLNNTQKEIIEQDIAFIDSIRSILIDGIYGTLINVQSKTNKNQLIPLDYDYILVIDTEGLLSIQKHDEQYDKRLILFCLAVSHLVIVNVEIEINEAVRKFFVLCTQALKYLGETRVTRPTVHFVLNKRPNPDEEYCKTLLECVRTTLKNNKLDNEINLQPDNFHVLSTAFNRNPFDILNGKCAAFSTDIRFVTNVQKLCKFLIDTSSDIIRQTGDDFCVPTSWIAFANRVLQTIKKHPDLTHFQDVFERDQYNKIRDDIRRDFDQYLSPTVARYLMDKEKQNSTDHIKDSFKIEYERILKTLEDRLREHCGQCQASENIQERSSRFMQVQLINIFRSWEVSARMASERYKIDQIVNDIENKLRAKAISVTHKNYLMNKQSATEMFDEELKDIFIQIKDKFKSEMVWKQSIDMVSHLCDVLDKDVLPTGNNILVYLPFLKTLDNGSSDQSISMDDCLSEIRAKFISEASSLDPLTSHLINMSSLISRNEIKQPHKCASENKSKLIERFLPWVVLIENDDENVAINCINELSQVLCQLFEPQIKEIIEKHINNEMIKTLNRCSIIKELDDEVYHATDDWLKRYVLYPIDLIVERFNEKWTRVKATVDEKLNMIVNLVSMRLREIFQLIKTVNTISQELGAHSLSFVDSLFQLKGEQRTDHVNDKQFCMAKLFYLYLVGEDIPREISTRNGSIYTVDSRWQIIIDNFPKPSAKIKQVFRLLQNAFEMSTISYLGFFLDKILTRHNEIELAVSNQMTSFIQKTYLIIKEQLSNRMRGCQAQCPCCKRICDVDHHLNITSPIGQEENRHRC
ncbi:unnamed protein product [Rotaria sp. Silwood1]|nr:unnamed protein product [Rotaria sp. Silwood1]CAF4903637.1 unnamed protein product [Rotaria sp. Silwood1]